MDGRTKMGGSTRLVMLTKNILYIIYFILSFLPVTYFLTNTILFFTERV